MSKLTKAEEEIMLILWDLEEATVKDVVGKIKLVPTDHDWVRSAREVGTCMGDE